MTNLPHILLEHLPPRTNKSDLLRLLDEMGGLPGNRVGRIDLAGGTARIEVPAGWEARLAKSLDGAKVHGRRIAAFRGRCDSDTATLGRADEHLSRLLRLLEIEREAEAQLSIEASERLSASEAERTGNALVDLAISDEETGLGGRYLLELSKRNRGPLPWTRLNVGSPVVLSSAADRQSATRGIVYDRRESSIRIAVSQLPEDAEEVEVWRLDLSHDEISSQRQAASLQRAQRADGDRAAELRDVLLGTRTAEFDEVQLAEPLSSRLNDAQQAAVAFALSARDVALIHGPPGTGKSTVLVELIRQAVRRGEKVLACGPSNLAVDNLLERLAASGERVVRLGHPARVLPELQNRTLDLMVEKHGDVRIARKLVKDALALFRRASRTTRARPEPGARREMRAEAKSLLADARRLESQAVEHILDTAEVVCATTTGLDDNLLGGRRFDLVVIDEACQSTEPGCWIAVNRANRLVLAGDHRQLPPTVLSDHAKREGFSVSLFERLADAHGSTLTRRLDVQYRMHDQIMEFSSLEFYDAELVSHDTVAAHTLSGLPGLGDFALCDSPLEFIDTAGAGFDEELEPDGESRLNRREVDLVMLKVSELLSAGMSAEQIGVITPYAAQVRLLKEKLRAAGVDTGRLDVDTVDGFQGREKEAIVISLVRSNERGEIGFLADLRRTNVAMTRARRKLIMIGDSATLSSEPFYGRLIAHFESRSAYHSVWEVDGLL